MTVGSQKNDLYHPQISHHYRRMTTVIFDYDPSHLFHQQHVFPLLDTKTKHAAAALILFTMAAINKY
jgi:hypothetical protein